MNLFFRIIGIIFILVILSCNSRNDRVENIERQVEKKKSLVRINKFLVKKDAEIIENYIKRRKWDMVETQEGLWYMVYKKGNGKFAEKDKIATLNYTISLLDGTLCYSSDSLGEKEFRIGQGGVESGLESGILFLREGDRARFLMPPHLAHGLLGDNNMIPARSTILYDVELLTITD